MIIAVANNKKLGFQIVKKHGADWIITKRGLGLLFVLGGLLGLVAILGLDILRGRSLDFGPTQKLVLGGCVGLIALGLTLIPLGDRPA